MPPPFFLHKKISFTVGPPLPFLGTHFYTAAQAMFFFPLTLPLGKGVYWAA